MSLSYHYTLVAPATAATTELERFLKAVEQDAKAMGLQSSPGLECGVQNTGTADVRPKTHDGVVG